AEESAKLTAKDFAELRALAGNSSGRFDEVYVDQRLRASGVLFGLAPGGVKGTAALRSDSRPYEGLYDPGPQGAPFPTRPLPPPGRPARTPPTQKAFEGAVPAP